MAEAGRRTLAERLDHLFDIVRRPDGQEYTNEHVANSVTAKGVTISQSYIWQLRKQKKDNPTLKHLQALADFFGVPPAYFFDDAVAGQIDEQIETLRAERERLSEASSGTEARLMAMRAGELSPDRRRQVMELLDVVYRLEQAERGDQPGK
ncbi:MAG TPA: helix-turn-helix domain-containing protein [Pseudonocardiaceae bacterium]|jgi:transcriptional regulator with XRE-family HTH domain|nr:helix-turn-helix domain-containing protein [Pseudonocardiaceae bacterium]